MSNRRRLIICALLIALASPLVSFAQDPEMADGMRSSGKIYVVVVVIGVILAGLLTYLFVLDRKIDNLEKKTK